jgi:hypothetical protein
VHECCDVVGTLQNLRINVAIDEIQQLIKYLFDVADLVQVGNDERVLGQELLLLLLEPLFKFVLDLLLLVFKFLLQVEEAFVDILHLLEFESLELFLHLLEQLAIFII